MKANIPFPPGWDDEVDVAVVGFGAAVVYAGGGTPYTQTAGYDDTPEEMYCYLKLMVRLAGLIAAQGGDAYLAFDSRTHREGLRQLWDQAAAFQLLYMLPALFLGRKKEQSLAALAAKLGVPPTQLQATMTAYNATADRGAPDPLGKSPECFVPQDRPPFYAIDCSLDWTKGVPCTAMTLGGLVVDEKTGQVLSADGSAIEGLYAAGRNAVGICSESYVSGLSIADCVFSGRRAGRHVALLSGNGRSSEAAQAREQRKERS